MPDAVERPPWSPLSVTVIAFLLPAGGAVLTIRNMQRLRVLDSPQARRMTIGAVVICAAGLGTILSLAPRSSAGIPNVDDSVRVILSFAVAFLCYVAQLAPFRSWQSKHRAERTAPWFNALGTAVLYTVVIAALTLPFVILAISVSGSAAAGAGQ